VGENHFKTISFIATVLGPKTFYILQTNKQTKTKNKVEVKTFNLKRAF